MPLKRRCLVPGCHCPGYRLDMEADMAEDGENLDIDRGELKPYCSYCGHAEEEHELAPSEE